MDVVHQKPKSPSLERTASPSHPMETPASAHRALEDLRYIRSCVENAGSFTGVPGLGILIVGVVALATSVVSSQVESHWAHTWVWLGAAGIAFVVGISFLVRKSHRAGASLLSGPGKRFGLSLLPPLLAGLVLTAVLVRVEEWSLLPGTWLLLYGTAVVTGGSFSIRLVTVMGLMFMGLGTAALMLPPGFGAWALALGFGGLHVVFGEIIRRCHGG